MRFVVLLLLVSVACAHAQPKSSAWMTDFTAAKTEAKKTGKPMFVVIRCEPCVDFAKFDPIVHRSGNFFDSFIRVRLTRISGLDLSLFEFDYDLSWVGLFMSAEGVVYGRYGGRDETGDQNRLSLEGLKYAASKAIEQHKTRADEKPTLAKPIFVDDFPEAKTRKRNNCIHCHEAKTFQWNEARKAGTWSREQRWTYPPPDNLGITFNVDRGDRIEKIVEGSPAAKAGLKPGDIVSKLNGLPIASFADAQHALHKAPAKGDITIDWKRGADSHSAKIELPEGWKQTEQLWRTSMLNELPSLHLSGEPISADDKKALGIPENQAAVRQDKFVHSTLRAAGVQAGDIIVGIDGKRTDGGLEQLEALARREHLVGEKAVLNIVRAGKTIELTLTLK